MVPSVSVAAGVSYTCDVCDCQGDCAATKPTCSQSDYTTYLDMGIDSVLEKNHRVDFTT